MTRGPPAAVSALCRPLTFAQKSGSYWSCKTDARLILGLLAVTGFAGLVALWVRLTPWHSV